MNYQEIKLLVAAKETPDLVSEVKSFLVCYDMTDLVSWRHKGNSWIPKVVLFQTPDPCKTMQT